MLNLRNGNATKNKNIMIHEIYRVYGGFTNDEWRFCLQCMRHSENVLVYWHGLCLGGYFDGQY